MLMIAGASLGHDEARFSPYAVGANAAAYRSAADRSFFVVEDARKVRIEIDGRTYEALLVSEIPQNEKIRFGN